MRLLLTLLLVFSLTACGGAGFNGTAFSGSAIGKTEFPAPPEDTGDFVAKPLATGKRQMVVTGHPLATEAAIKMLDQGGTAMDAVVAAQAMLTLVEPQSSGIGGGGFLMYYDAKKKRTLFFDGRERAPYSASARQFLDANGKPLKFYDAVIGGTAVGVPGIVKLLESAHSELGLLHWHDTIMPAVEAAREGVPVTPRLARQIAADPYLPLNPAARAVFYDNRGRPLAPGAILENPALAETLKRIAVNGSRELYANYITDDIMKAVNTAAHRPGNLNINDFVLYDVVKRKALCGKYRDYTVCSAPAPSSGGIALLQALSLLEKYDLKKLGADNPQSAFLITEASKLAFADRDRFVADPAYIRGDLSRLLDKKYLESRAKLLNPNKSMGVAAPGQPGGGLVFADAGAAIEPISTTHISIVDRYGNAASLTSSIENVFGSRIFVRGFFLNNQLTDFSFIPEVNGVPVANRVEPGKRPRSSMSPTMIFDKKGQLRYVLGSPGGSRIIGYVLHSVVALVDWEQGLDTVVAAPRITNRNGVTELEQDRASKELGLALEAKGQDVSYVPMVSGLNIIARDAKGNLTGAADPRRDGAAKGN